MHLLYCNITFSKLAYNIGNIVIFAPEPFYLLRKFFKMIWQSLEQVVYKLEYK